MLGGNLSGSILTCEGDESLMFGLGKKKEPEDYIILSHLPKLSFQ